MLPAAHVPTTPLIGHFEPRAHGAHKPILTDCKTLSFRFVHAFIAGGREFRPTGSSIHTYSAVCTHAPPCRVQMRWAAFQSVRWPLNTRYLEPRTKEVSLGGCAVMSCNAAYR